MGRTWLWVGRLAPRNPAYALPALRRHLLQLLTELEHSTESHLREESALLMAALVRSCTRLVMPYIAPILRTLMMKLRKPEDAAAASKPGGKDGSGGKDSGGKDGDGKGGDGGKKKGIAGDGGGGGGQGGGGGGGGDGGGFGGEADVGGVGAGTTGNYPGALATAVDRDDRGMSSSGSLGPGGGSASLFRGKGGIGGAGGNSPSHLTHIVSVREKAAVLGTIGELAQVGGVGMRSFVPDLLVLIIDGIKMGSTRDIAVITMGQLIESTGYVMRPFTDHPQLLSLMLRILAEEAGPVRAEVLRTLGILGALDPHSHRDNEERLHGQGLLSMEGVRGVGRAGQEGGDKGDSGEKGEKGGVGGGGSAGGGYPGSDGNNLLQAWTRHVVQSFTNPRVFNGSPSS